MHLPELPVSRVLPALVDTLRATGAAVLVAPPGTGKTTLAPLALAEAVTGRVVVAAPRRVAVRAAAHRMASLLGERVGGTVGYAVRGDRRSGPTTRIEVVTTGLLVRRLQHDPELPGTAAVLLDECHERQLDADLALAFGVEARAALRPDLWLVAMSATAEADRFADLLGTASGPAPVLRADGALHPVTTIWSPPPAVAGLAGTRRPGRTGPQVDPVLLDHVAATIRRALHERDGDLLVFLPGAAEIAGVTGRLADLRGTVDLIGLHGRQSGREQDAALRPGQRRRVVLATSVAESSLTVPGVRVVVDAGLSRVPRMDVGRGLGALVTVPVSRASATQRAGRAGREAPGYVYRCWSAERHDRLPAQSEPEIAGTDLTGFALQLACWGQPDGSGLALPEPPPPAAFRVARETLAALGAVDSDGRVTPRGRAMAAVGVHPRLARALLDGAPRVGADRAAGVVALLAEESVVGAGDDLAALWRRLRAGTDPAATDRWRAEVRRLTAALPPAGPASDRGAGPASSHSAGPASSSGAGDLPDDLAAALVVGLAYPERLARVRQPGGSTYLMSAGTAAQLATGSALAGTPWLAVAVADRAPGGAAARIRLAAPLDETTAREVAGPLLHTAREVGWAGTDVVARETSRLGAIVLAERPLPAPDPGLLTAALLTGLREVGLSLLTWSPAARSLRDRMAFCRHVLGEPWPELTDAALLATAADWLGPDLAVARRRADLARIDLLDALRRLLPWPQAARLDEVAPDRLAVPSGSRIRVDYSDPARPVLAVKLQETFGWAQAPRIGDGRVAVLLHLLSPAGRPVAVTADLASFWQTGYPQVRAELRGRYPRHPWPEDPTTAPPTRHTTARRR